jgi:hypothetical protein
MRKYSLVLLAIVVNSAMAIGKAPSSNSPYDILKSQFDQASPAEITQLPSPQSIQTMFQWNSKWSCGFAHEGSTALANPEYLVPVYVPSTDNSTPGIVALESVFLPGETRPSSVEEMEGGAEFQSAIEDCLLSTAPELKTLCNSWSGNDVNTPQPTPLYSSDRKSHHQLRTTYRVKDGMIFIQEMILSYGIEVAKANNGGETGYSSYGFCWNAGTEQQASALTASFNSTTN